MFKKPKIKKVAIARTAAVAPKAVQPSQPRTDIQPLLGDLRSADGAKRVAAAAALGRTSQPGAVAALVTALGDADADVARAAAVSLGLLGDASAVQPLIDAVKNSDGYFHSIVRVAAATSLGQLRDLRAVEPLMNAVRDPIVEVSAETMRALAALGDARAVVALHEVVANANGFYLPVACSTAAMALARFDANRTALA